MAAVAPSSFQPQAEPVAYNTHATHIINTQVYQINVLRQHSVLRSPNRLLKTRHKQTDRIWRSMMSNNSSNQVRPTSHRKHAFNNGNPPTREHRCSITVTPPSMLTQANRQTSTHQQKLAATSQQCVAASVLLVGRHTAAHVFLRGSATSQAAHSMACIAAAFSKPSSSTQHGMHCCRVQQPLTQHTSGHALRQSSSTREAAQSKQCVAAGFSRHLQQHKAAAKARHITDHSSQNPVALT